MYCNKCNNYINNKNNNFCEKCGNKLIKTNANKNDKKISIIITTIIIAIIIINVIPIINKTKNTTQKTNINEIAIEKIERKYNDSCIYSAAYGSSLDETRNFFITCDKLSNQKVLVEIENFRSENPIFRDSYIPVKYQEQTNELFRNILTKYFKDVRILYSANEIITDLPSSATFNDFINDKNAHLIVMIEVKESDKISTEQQNKLANDLKKYIYDANFTFVYSKDNEYGTLNRNELGDKISTNELDYIKISIKNNEITRNEIVTKTNE